MVVKVKRPYVETNFRRDVALFKMIAKFFETLGISKQMRWAAMSKELEEIVLNELNYRLEADAAARMHKSLLNHAVYAPKVFFRFCTNTTIVLEYLNGVKMSDYLYVHERDPARCARWCVENRVKPKRVAYRLFASLQRQIFEDNLFHADLHPGNIMLLRNNRFGLIDFGAVGALEGTFRKQLNQYNALIAEGSYIKAAEIYLDISSPLPALSSRRLRHRVGCRRQFGPRQRPSGHWEVGHRDPLIKVDPLGPRSCGRAHPVYKRSRLSSYAF